MTGKKFGDHREPAAGFRSFRRTSASMPGMMDTILNLGLNDEVVDGHGQEDRSTPALLMTATAASSRCTPTSSWKLGKSYL